MGLSDELGLTEARKQNPNDLAAKLSIGNHHALDTIH